MSREKPLLFSDQVYADMVQHHYDAARWMQMSNVLGESARIPRSKKKLVQLFRKGVMLSGDVLTMTRTSTDGVAVSLSATIAGFDQHASAATMMPIGQIGHTQWSCDSPQSFLQFMKGIYPNLMITLRNTWETIVVVRNGQQLGTLQEVRQCFQLWEDEMEKWGCNGLGERVPGRKAPPQDRTSTAT